MGEIKISHLLLSLHADRSRVAHALSVYKGFLWPVLQLVKTLSFP
jgi:hypothetical protein